MGLRGMGAEKRKDAIAKVEAAGGPRRMRWEKKGLSRLERSIAFLESLPITKGKLQGRKMKLLPDQVDFLKELFDEDREVPVRIAIKSEPRGNGKTGFLAGLCCDFLFGPESEPRGEIDSAAIDRQMAGILFNEMEAIIYAVPEFAARVNVQRFNKKIEVLEGPGKGSTYEALSADARRAHGLAPTLWVYDELAQAKDRVLLDNLMTAMGKRERSLGVIISTQAPDDDHPLSQLIDDGLSGKDPSIFVQLTCAPEDADPFDPKVIRAANKALGIFLDENDIMSEAERARRIPAFEPAFRNLRLNQRVDARTEDRIVPAPVWKQCSGPGIIRKLAGRRAYGGLDLSGSEDLTALVLSFPDDEKDRGYDMKAWFWTPQGRLESRTPAERDQFKLWIKQGYIEAVPGPVIRMDFVVKKLAELNREYDLILGYDRWGIKRLEQELLDEGVGLTMEPFGQGYMDMSPAIVYFTELLLTGRIRHGGNPVLTACVANAVVVPDAAGNRKIDKGLSNKRATVRVDGAVAAAISLGIAQRHIVEPADSLDDFLSAGTVAA